MERGALQSLGGETLDIRQILEVFSRYYRLIILAAILGALGAFITSHLQHPIYEARTQVLVTRASSPVSTGGDIIQYASLGELTATYKELLTQDWMRERVAERIGGEVDKNAVKVSTSTNAMVISIAAQDPDPMRAMVIANTLVQVLVEQNEALQASRYSEAEKRLSLQISQVQSEILALQRRLSYASEDKRSELMAELDLYRQLYLDLLDKRETVRLQKLQNMPNVIQVNEARLLDKPVRPRTLLNTLMGAIMGLVVAVGGVFLKETLDTSIRREEDMQALGVPVLATLMRVKDLQEGKGPYAMLSPRSPYAEALRVLRTNLEFLGVDKPLSSLLITSAGSEEGKTTLAVNLAAIMAQANKRVLLIDADLRRPRVHRVLGVVNRAGLSTLFRSDLPAIEACRRWKDTSLYFLTSGSLPPNPAELLASEKMRRILEELKASFDFVILDTPPGFVADAQLISSYVDGVLVVGRYGQTNRIYLKHLVEQFQRVEAHMLGAVFFVDEGQIFAANHYGYAYYAYAYPEVTDEGNRPRGKPTAGQK